LAENPAKGLGRSLWLWK